MNYTFCKDFKLKTYKKTILSKRQAKLPEKYIKEI